MVGLLAGVAAGRLAPGGEGGPTVPDVALVAYQGDDVPGGAESRFDDLLAARGVRT